MGNDKRVLTTRNGVTQMHVSIKDAGRLVNPTLKDHNGLGKRLRLASSAGITMNGYYVIRVVDSLPRYAGKYLK